MTGIKHSQGKLPYFTVLIEQFPLAIKEVVKRAEFGHQKYIETDADYKNWQRIENAEQQYKNAAMRHLFQDGEENEDEIQHLAAAAWSLLAVLQLKLNVSRKTS